MGQPDGRSDPGFLQSREQRQLGFFFKSSDRGGSGFRDFELRYDRFRWHKRTYHSRQELV